MTVSSTLTPSTGEPAVHLGEQPITDGLERRGRLWLLWSFLLCPCHLPLTLGVLGAMLAGTSVGAVFRDHAWVAGTLLTVSWLAGTGYGFHLIRRSQRANGTCPIPTALRA